MFELINGTTTFKRQLPNFFRNSALCFHFSTVRARDPCALICPNTPRANDPCALNCPNTPRADFNHGPCCFRQILAEALLQHGSATRSVQDPCALIFLAHGPCLSSYGPCLFAFTYTYYAVPLLDEFDL